MKLNLNLLALLAAGAAATLVSGSALASEAMMKKARCNACHNVEKKVVGPAFKEVAARYKGQADAPAKLFEKVRAGGAGNWGEIPMMANGPDKISDADLKAVIDWVLSLN